MKVVLNKYREFARYIDREIKVKKGSIEWSTIPLYKQIEIPKAIDETSEILFLQSVEKKLPDNYKNLVNEFPSYTWSFLHEVGHIECNHIQGNSVFRIFANFIGSLGFAKIANSIYFKLKEERQATEWAINYAIHNTNIVRKFTNELQKVYCRYYKSMNLEE